jgi:hypothetical protein
MPEASSLRLNKEMFAWDSTPIMVIAVTISLCRA